MPLLIAVRATLYSAAKPENYIDLTSLILLSTAGCLLVVLVRLLLTFTTFSLQKTKSFISAFWTGFF
jgi:hypothetical protein